MHVCFFIPFFRNNLVIYVAGIALVLMFRILKPVSNVGFLLSRSSRFVIFIYFVCVAYSCLASFFLPAASCLH